MSNDLRINLEMSVKEMVLVLAGGNPGAMNVCMDIFNGDDGVMTLLRLDTAQIYGSDIWLLYKDVCGEDLGKMKTILLAKQWGIVTQGVLRHAMDSRGKGIDWDVLTEAVKKGMPV